MSPPLTDGNEILLNENPKNWIQTFLMSQVVKIFVCFRFTKMGVSRVSLKVLHAEFQVQVSDSLFHLSMKFIQKGQTRLRDIWTHLENSFDKSRGKQ